jgi:hypothetical protein
MPVLGLGAKVVLFFVILAKAGIPLGEAKKKAGFPPSRE